MQIYTFYCKQRAIIDVYLTYNNIIPYNKGYKTSVLYKNA